MRFDKNIIAKLFIPNKIFLEQTGINAQETIHKNTKKIASFIKKTLKFWKSKSFFLIFIFHCKLHQLIFSGVLVGLDHI